MEFVKHQYFLRQTIDLKNQRQHFLRKNSDLEKHVFICAYVYNGLKSMVLVRRQSFLWETINLKNQHQYFLRKINNLKKLFSYALAFILVRRARPSSDINIS